MTGPPMAKDELEFVNWLRTRQRPHPAVALGIGDDMAVLAPEQGLWLVSCDMLLDGVHFDAARQPLALIGRKAVACGLSDCAAMAARPRAITVSLALPADRSLADAQELFRGMSAIAEEYDTSIVGGDTARWKHPLAIDVAVVAASFEGIDPITRAGAKPGDNLYVTGPLGGSLRGRHLTFTPRIIEARAIAEALGTRLHAMIDISDGLSLDLWRMCQASGVGALLNEQQLGPVIHEDARAASREDGRTPLDHALNDGEDFELLLAAEGDASVPGVPLWAIGQVTPSQLRLRRAGGKIEPLEPRGYVH